MADGTLFVKVTQTQATPEDYLVSGAAAIDLLAVRAVFDGSGAGGDFVPVVQIVNEANEVMLQCVGETVTAGDSASITFAPFLRTAAAASPGGGIQYDLEQIGDWFFLGTDSGNGGWGIFLNSQGTSSGQGILIQADGNVDPIHIFVTNDTGGILIEDGGGGIIIREESGFGHVSIQDHGSGGTEIHTDAYLDVQAAQRIFLNLPTSAGTAGSLWNDAGTVKVS
jgi:hypothetical protein